LKQQASVFLAGILIVAYGCGIAGSLARNAVFPCRHMGEWMEEEQVAGERRDASPPQVAAAQMCQFMGENQLQVFAAEQCAGRQQQHGIDVADEQR
jgi:hypothetical protein